MAQPLRIGPQAPDDYGAASKGLRVDARALIAAGEAAYPPELRAAMGRRVDEVASAALDLEALSGELGVKVVAASVRGFPGEEQVLVYLFQEDSGRTGRWSVPLEETAAEGMAETAHQEAEKADQETQARQNEMAGLEPDAEAPTPNAPAAPETPSPQERTDEALADERAEGDQEPWPGYDEETVAEIQDHLATADAGLKSQVASYEAAHKNRTGVLGSTGG